MKTAIREFKDFFQINHLSELGIVGFNSTDHTLLFEINIITSHPKKIIGESGNIISQLLDLFEDKYNKSVEITINE